MKRTNQRLSFEARIHGIDIKVPVNETEDLPDLTERQKAEMEQVFFQQRQRMMKRG